MIALLRTYLAPYKGTLAVVVALLFVQAIATLYLPALNGDIINNGVAKGDTSYILSTGMLMLGISLIVVITAIIAVFFGSKTGMRCPSRHSRRRSRFSSPTASTSGSTPPTATRRRRLCRTRSWSTTADGRPGSPTASSSPRRTTRPRTAGSSTTRPTAVRPTPT